MPTRQSLTKTSRFLAMVLRHKPHVAGIELDEHGWANVDELVEGMSALRPFSREILEEIVTTDAKRRYAFNEDHTLVRANQGHSIPVDVELAPAEPPAMLYHGTATRFLSSIAAKGLLPMGRLHVHLSRDEATAVKVGERHGEPVVLTVDASAMRSDGYEFFLSANGVWLTKVVPPRYLGGLEKEGS